MEAAALLALALALLVAISLPLMLSAKRWTAAEAERESVVSPMRRGRQGSLALSLGRVIERPFSIRSRNVPLRIARP